MTSTFMVDRGPFLLTSKGGTNVSGKNKKMPSAIHCCGDEESFLEAFAKYPVDGVDVSRISKLGDRAFEMLKNAHQLTRLTLDCPPLNDKQCAALCTLPNLDLISLTYLEDTTEALQNIIANPSISRVSVCGSPVALNDGKMLISKSNLRALRIEFCECDADRIVESNPSSKLEVLTLSEIGLTSVGMKRVSQWCNLKDLSVPGQILGDEAFEQIANLKLLEELHADSTGITSAIGPNIAKLKAMKVLALSDNPIDDQLIPHLLQLPALTRLYLDGCKLSEAGIERLKCWEQLDVFYDGSGP